jgi:hypothetical protein
MVEASEFVQWVESNFICVICDEDVLVKPTTCCSEGQVY